MPMLDLTPEMFQELRRLGETLESAIRSHLVGADGEVKSPLHLLIAISVLSHVAQQCIKLMLPMIERTNIPIAIRNALRDYYEQERAQLLAMSRQAMDHVGEVATSIKPVENSVVGVFEAIITALNDDYARS